MKKKIIFAFAVAVSISAFAVGYGITYTKVSDSCGKCKITQTQRKCGLCGGSMSSKLVDSSTLEYEYTCTKCKHSCRYKLKQ